MNKEKGFALFGAAVLIALIVPLSVMLNGFVLMKIWNWFMPLLNVSTITIPIAIGLSCLPSLFRNRSVTEKKLTLSEAMVSIVATPLFLLLFAYIATLFI